MSKTTIYAFIISFAALLYALISALLVERKIEDTENKKTEKFSKAIQRGVARIFSEPHQEAFIFVVVAAIIMSVSRIGFKSASVFVFGAIIALAVEKIALKIVSSLALRVGGQYEKGRKSGIGIILASSGVVSIFAAGFILLILTLSYGVIRDVNLILPFALGISTEAVFVKLFSGIFAKTAGKSEIKDLKDVSEGADIVACGVEFTENLILIAGTAMVIGALTPAGVNGRAVILPLALISLVVVILLLNIVAFKIFKQFSDITQIANISLIVSVVAMLAGSFFAVKTLIGHIQLFWPIAIGAVLVLVLEIFRKYIDNSWKLAVYLAAIYFALTVSLKFDGINALALSAIGMISVLSIVFVNNFVAGFAKTCEGALDNFTIKKDVQERFSTLSSEKARKVLDEMSIPIVLVLFVLLAYFLGIKSINIEAGRTLFALFSGGLISVFAQSVIKDAVKSVNNKLSGQNGSLLEGGSLKLLFREISKIIIGKELIIIAIIIGVPVIFTAVLGVSALIALLAGITITAFALQESETISVIKLLLILMIVLLPIL